MLVVQVKEGENIERALKRYKKKYDKTKVVRQLRSRKEYIKPSVANRKTRLKAAYIEAKYGVES
ncbi:MAG: 30S ribosomal protein S21 [Flavobacteriales bacterium]